MGIIYILCHINENAWSLKSHLSDVFYLINYRTLKFYKLSIQFPFQKPFYKIIQSNNFYPF